MESFLNLLWVVIAISGLGAWRACWIRQHRDRRRNPLREWSAVVCALVFIFFAVSLSDDLQTDRIVLDEAIAARRQAAALNIQHSSPQSNKSVPQHSFAVVPQTSLPSSLAAVSSVECSADAPRRFRANRMERSRAPPYFLL